MYNVIRQRRTPPGVRGLKLRLFSLPNQKLKSHPTRGAWIEMPLYCILKTNNIKSHPTRGAWIEIFNLVDKLNIS